MSQILEKSDLADREQTAASKESTQIRVSPRRVLRFLLIVVAVVVLVGVTANYAIYNIADDPDSSLARVLRRLDLGHEPSIPHFYSAVALLFAAGLLALIGRSEQLRRIRGWHFWYLLGALFVLLSVDEAVMIHEMVDTFLSQSLDTSGILYFPWVLAGGLLALFAAIIFIPFVAGRSRRTLLLFIAAGLIYLGGAIGMELVAALIFDQAGSPQAGVASIAHTISQGFEESLEMLGVVIFIYALLDYLSNDSPCVVTCAASQQRTAVS